MGIEWLFPPTLERMHVRLGTVHSWYCLWPRPWPQNWSWSQGAVLWLHHCSRMGQVQRTNYPTGTMEFLILNTLLAYSPYFGTLAPSFHLLCPKGHITSWSHLSEYITENMFTTPVSSEEVSLMPEHNMFSELLECSVSVITFPLHCCKVGEHFVFPCAPKEL